MRPSKRHWAQLLHGLQAYSEASAHSVHGKPEKLSIWQVCPQPATITRDIEEFKQQFEHKLNHQWDWPDQSNTSWCSFCAGKPTWISRVQHLEESYKASPGPYIHSALTKSQQREGTGTEGFRTYAWLSMLRSKLWYESLRFPYSLRRAANHLCLKATGGENSLPQQMLSELSAQALCLLYSLGFKRREKKTKHEMLILISLLLIIKPQSLPVLLLTESLRWPYCDHTLQFGVPSGLFLEHVWQRSPFPSYNEMEINPESLLSTLSLWRYFPVLGYTFFLAVA